MKALHFAVVLSALAIPATAATLFTSNFDANTGATVLAGNTDNVSGSSSVTITDWSTDASVTSISGLTAISTDDGGTTTAGGFAQLQGGSATYANPDVVYLSRNHNVDATRGDNYRGFSLSFTLSDSWGLSTLTVLSGHTNNAGNQDQAFTSDLVFNLTGGTLGSPLTGSSNEDYGSGSAYRSVAFDLTGTTLGAGSYTLDVYQTNMPSGGAYATYDGITLEAIPEPTAALLGSLGLLGLLRRRR
jgi:hypothetical protein